MTAAEVLKTVRTIINDAATEGDSFSAETDAALREFLVLALGLLSAEGVAATPTTVTKYDSANFRTRPDGLLYVEIPLPDDFLRFISVQLGGWPYPVTRLYPDDGPLFQAQYSAATGVGNGPSLPIAFLSGDTTRSVIAHAVALASSYTLKYVPLLSVASDGTVNLRERYAGALAYFTAALYHNSVEDRQLAELELGIARGMAAKAKKEEDAV
jgi:hypothetical protein